MISLRVLILLGVLTWAWAQDCTKSIDDFHQCVRDSIKPGRRGAGQGPPDFEEIKKKADACFTDNGCEPPQLPPGPRPGSNGVGPGGPRGGSSGEGERGDDQGVGGGRGTLRQCFQTVANKTKDYILRCVRKTDPGFSFPEKGGFGGGPGGHHGPGAGGPGGPGGHGGPGGPGPHGPHVFRGGVGKKALLDACKNKADAADKVNTCLATVFPRPDPSQMRKAFEEHCKAKSDCQAKLGTCKDALEKRRQAMCTCGQEVQSKRDEFMAQEPACAEVQSKMGTRRPGSFKQRDCKEKPEDPCQQGFDALMKQAGTRPGPN